MITASTPAREVPAPDGPARTAGLAAATSGLPVADALPALRGALAAGGRALLIAPPGAGKTTLVPLALLDEPWVGAGRLLVLEPRRVAARAAAARMASLVGEPLGERVGLRARLDVRVSARTRIEVVTEGVFTRLALDDPELRGVAGVIFDEFHERSLDADLGLALALDAASALRPDLRLLVMSATLDAEPVSALLGTAGNPAPVIRSEGRAYPVETRHAPRSPSEPVEAAMASACLAALADSTGSVLAFLPGQREIARTLTVLEERLGSRPVDVLPLHGSLDPRAQDAALALPEPGRRRIVLATAIAETSLTLPDVRIVVDSGLARVPVFEPALGLTRLETRRASRATIDQRRGRAGRVAPGLCVRLWEAAGEGALPAFPAPEMLAADLTDLALDLAEWGVADPAALPWLDPPPRAAWERAVARLRSLRALDEAGRPTALGRAARALPVPVHVARMALIGAAGGEARLAARLAVLLTERGAGGDDPDLARRLERFEADRGPRAEALRGLADALSRRAREAAARLGDEADAPGRAAMTLGGLVALAYPDRVALRRDGGEPGAFTLANGRGAHLDPAHPLSRERLLAVGALAGTAARPRALEAAALDDAALEAACGEAIVRREEVSFDARAGALRARAQRRLGALTLGSRPLPTPATPEAAALLARGWAEAPSRWLFDEDGMRLRGRIAFLRRSEGAGGRKPGSAAGGGNRVVRDNGGPEKARRETPLEGEAEEISGREAASPRRGEGRGGGGFVEAEGGWPDVSDEGLARNGAPWLAPLLAGLASLDAIGPDLLWRALLAALPPGGEGMLEREAPPRFLAPTGTRAAIDYAAEAGPTVSLRVQELYGLDRHPSVAGGRVPLVLELLSPAHRPIQTTRDLPGFWRGSWEAVRRDLRGRYPRHLWPERPWEAQATTRAKPRGT